MWLLPAGSAWIKLRHSQTKKLYSKSGKLVESPMRQEIYSFIKGRSNTWNLIQKLFRRGFFTSFRELKWTKQLSKWRSVHFLGLAALFAQVWKLIWTLVWTKQVSSGPPEHLAANQMWLLVLLQINPGANYTIHHQWESASQRERVRERESERETDRQRTKEMKNITTILFSSAQTASLSSSLSPWARTTFWRTCHGCSPPHASLYICSTGDFNVNHLRW